MIDVLAVLFFFGIFGTIVLCLVMGARSEIDSTIENAMIARNRRHVAVLVRMRRWPVLSRRTRALAETWLEKTKAS